MRDDWEKPRGKKDYLTADEVQKLKVAFNCGRKPADIARELKCSTRTAHKYFAEFRGQPNIRNISEKKPSPPPIRHRPIKIEKQSRFYKGNFDL